VSGCSRQRYTGCWLSFTGDITPARIIKSSALQEHGLEAHCGHHVYVKGYTAAKVNDRDIVYYIHHQTTLHDDDGQ
jgi:hypothetical protein